MKLDNRMLAGLLLAFAAAQFMFAMMLAEASAPDYSMHENAISDLGTIDETRLFFNASMVAIGLLNLLAGFYFYKVHDSRSLMIVFALGGIGAMGAGLIPLDSKLGVHGIFAFMAFLFINIEAILAGRLVKDPLRLFSFVAGALGLVFLVMMILVDSETVDPSGSIGHGGVERMIAYPGLVWMMIFGGHLVGSAAPLPRE